MKGGDIILLGFEAKICKHANSSLDIESVHVLIWKILG